VSTADLPGFGLPTEAGCRSGSVRIPGSRITPIGGQSPAETVPEHLHSMGSLTAATTPRELRFRECHPGYFEQ